MKVTIDPAIEKDPELRQGVAAANEYLERQLVNLPDAAEVRWSVAPNQPDEVILRLSSADEIPAEATVTISRDRFREPDRRTFRVWDALDSWLSQWIRFRLRRLEQSLQGVEA
jgi:hypothetical protein